MSVYTVHEPPQRDTGASVDPERFVFVRDGFYFWALVFGPLWLLWRRLWLVLLFYVIAFAAVAGALWFMKAGMRRAGRDHAGLRRCCSAWRPRACGAGRSTRRGWKNLGVVVGDDLESAERRFFQVWRERPQAASAPKSAVLTNYGPKSADGSSDVIGLFPEPGGPR